jgi:DNA-binding SARP family transcriptional activator
VANTVGGCRLLLLGPPLFQRDDRAAPIRLRKGLALAAYLAVEQRAFSREYLATLLWPDLGQQGALANLRRMLTHLRETMGGRCIRTDGDLLQFDPGMVDVDVAEFQSQLHVPPTDSGLGQLETAAALYRGSFLEGFMLGDCLEFDEWQDGVRRRMAEQFDELLETLCRGHLHAGQVKSALPFARRWLELDRLNEAAHRMLMEIYTREGRPDLARRQYESCSRTLSREGLEPEGQTRDLFSAITGHRLGPDTDVPAESGDPQGSVNGHVDRAARRRAWRWIAPVAAGILVAAAAATWFTMRYIFASDMSVAAVEPSLRGNELTRIRIVLKNDGIARPRVRYAVAFSSDQAVVAPRDYMVFADEIRMRLDGEVTVEVDALNDIREYVGTHNVEIPPGTYSLAVIIDPEDRIWEHVDLNNRLTNGTQFFYPGTAPEAAFEVHFMYNGSGALSEANPLKLFIGSSTSVLQREGRWARFTVTGEGTYFLPVADVPERDSNGSGYVMVMIHDVHNDLQSLDFPGPGDVGAIYREGTTNLTYGVFNSASGTPIHPGRSYRIDFSPPKPPAADAYEEDDTKEGGTRIDYGALPVRQHHTFHDEGTGDIDQDWFQITLGAGDTLTVETCSAGGAWECDTAIDIADSQRYLRTGNDKSEYDLYSRLTCTNDATIDKVFFFQVKPWPKYLPGINRFADYIVEFRR